jgi:hypothetical protein
VSIVETSMTLHLEQIIDGKGMCDGDDCAESAAWTISTGPDPEPALLCAEHAYQWLDTTGSVVRKLGR